MQALLPKVGRVQQQQQQQQRQGPEREQEQLQQPQHQEQQQGQEEEQELEQLQQQQQQQVQEQEQLQQQQEQPQQQGQQQGQGQEGEQELEQLQLQQQAQEQEQLQQPQPQQQQQQQQQQEQEQEQEPGQEHGQEQEQVQQPQAQTQKQGNQSAQKPKKKRKRLIPKELSAPPKNTHGSKRQNVAQPPGVDTSTLLENDQHSDSIESQNHLPQRPEGWQQHEQEQQHLEGRQPHRQPRRHQLHRLQESLEATAGQEKSVVDDLMSLATPLQRAGALPGTSSLHDSDSNTPQYTRKRAEARLKQLDEEVKRATAAAHAASSAFQQALDWKREWEAKQAKLEEAVQKQVAAQERWAQMRLSQAQELERLKSKQAHILVTPLKGIEELKKAVHQAQQEADMACKALL